MATIASVILAMDSINEAFASGSIDGCEFSAPIKHILSIGKKTLNKYYALMDHSTLYHMAMGKCCHIKLLLCLLTITIVLQ